MAKDKSSGNKKKSKKSEASQESKFSKDRRELSWQEKIIESPLNDDNFKCNVTMFVEANVEYNEYLTEFANGIEVGSRKCISAVTMKDIQELSASKDRKHPKEKESPKSDKSSSKKGNRTPKKTPNDEKQSPVGVPRELQELMQQMSADGAFTSDILALAIKTQLLAVKNKFVEKKEIEIQLANDIERETKNICDQGEPGKKGKDKKEPKTAKAKKKGEKGDGDKKVATIETADKKRTQLRKRGEEWRDITYVEDSPVEGPDLYIALIGFYDPRLPLELRKAGVPLQGLVKVVDKKIMDEGPFPCTVTTTDLAPIIEEEVEEEFVIEQSETVFVSFVKKAVSDVAVDGNEMLPEEEEAEEESTSTSLQISVSLEPIETVSSFGLSSRHDTEASGLDQFWNEIGKPETQKMIKDIAVVDLVPENAPQRPEDEPQAWREGVYNEMSYVMFDLQDHLRHHANYLDNICLQFLGPYPPLNKSEMELYDTMVNLMPAECTSVSYVLHCMLEQVLMFQAPRNPSPSPGQSVSEIFVLSNEQSGIDAKKYLESQLDLLDIHYGLSKCEVFDYEISDPKVLLHGDIQLQLTRQVQIPEINIAEITMDLLKWYPFIKLWEQYPELNGSEQLMYSYHVKKLLEYMELDFLTERLLKFYLMLSVFEKIPCSLGLSKKISDLKSSCSSQNESCNQVDACQSEELPPDDIRNLKDLIECPELVNLLQRIPGEEDDNSSRMEQHFYTYNMFRYSHMETLRPQVMLQALQDGLSRYNCIDYEYFKPTDTLLFKFHNVEEQLKWQHHWTCSIRTPVSFKDFNTYVYVEDKDWIDYQEEMYKKDLAEKSKEKPEMADAETQISVEMEEPCLPEEFRLENSLKDKNGEDKKTSSSLPKLTEKISTVSFDVASGKKSKAKETTPPLHDSTSKTGAEQLSTAVGLTFTPSHLISALHYADTKSYSFVGYDLGSHRVQNSGATTVFNSPDGSSVKIELTKWLYENTLIYSEFTKLGHTLSLYSYSGPPPFVDEPLTFHVTTSSGIILAFGRRTPLTAPSVEEHITVDAPPPQEQEVTAELSTKASGTKRSGKKGKDKGKKSETVKNVESEKNIEIAEEPMKGEKASEASPRQEVNFIYDMCVSCPSSLTIETKVTTDEIDPFYIKQSYLTKGPKCDRIRDELFRCFLRNGNILIFRTDGTVQILALDGTVIHCREFQPPELPVAEIPAPSVDINALIETEEKVSKKKKAKTSAEPKNKKGRKGKKDTENEVQEEKVEEVQEKEAVPTPLPEILPLWDITEYEMWMAHGEKYRVTNGKKEKMEPPFLLRIATDFESGEVYTRREEGTNTLLKPNGTLIVAFPDGSRITATPKDDGEFEWTPEEEREIYEAALMSTISVKDSAKIESNFSIEAPEMTFSQVVDSSKLSSDMSSQDYKTGTTKSSILNVSTLESYVLITMKCTAEHPNYATVQYKGYDQSALITCPSEMKIHVDARGIYKAFLDVNMVLDVQPMSITFEAFICNDCQSTSRTYVGLRGFQDPEKGDDIMSSTTDNWGNTFNVTYSGAAKHHMRTADESVSTELCPPKLLTGLPRYLVLQRDLSGIEFIHSDELENQLAVIEATQNASLTVDPMPGKAEIFNCYTMFMPLPKTESGKWIKTINLESHLPTNLKRKDLTRSTYGDPPSWLFPFPRQKKAKLKSTSAMTIQNLSSDEKFPKFLVVRIVHGLEAADHNIIDAVQAGLARYWQEAQNIYHKYDAYKMEDTRTPEEIELEDKLFELAVTQTPREVVEMYRKGINPANIIPDLKTTHKQSQHQMYLDAFYKKLEEDKENADFFRNLLKMKSVPKYFDTIEGESFISILETVDEAVNISRYDCTQLHEHTDTCRDVAMKEKGIKSILEEILPVGDSKVQSKRIQVNINGECPNYSLNQ